MWINCKQTEVVPYQECIRINRQHNNLDMDSQNYSYPIPNYIADDHRTL